jgi:hypothetical protein
LFGCNTKETNNNPPVQKAGEESDPLANTIYFGEMFYFPETDEFYTSAYFYPDLEEAQKESVSSLLDSTVYSDKDRKRSRVPLPVALKTFMLEGLDSVFIYDTDHKFISKVALVRVEYFKNKIEDKFIAVYKGDKLVSDPAEQYYCSSKAPKDLLISGFSYRTVNNESLNDFLLYKLNAKKNLRWQIKNIEVLPYKSTYSVITSSEESFITELNGNQFTILKNMNGKYRIEDILPIPFEVNEKPLLLASLYIPGIEPRSTSLAVFTDIGEYRILSYNRLNIKNPNNHPKGLLQN